MLKINYQKIITFENILKSKHTTRKEFCINRIWLENIITETKF